MARTPKNLAADNLATTTLTTIYTAPSGVNGNISTLEFTNLDASNHVVISMYRNNGGSDVHLGTITIPAGVGISRVAHSMSRKVFESGQILKFQLSAAVSIDYDLNGSEVEI